MTSLPPEDEAPELGVAFQLPADVLAKPELAELYLTSVRKLQAESRGIPMHTVQEFLLERIATKYVMLRYHEIYGGWRGVNSEKDATAQWLDMVKEWNKVLATGHEQLRAAFLDEFTSIAMKGVELIEDKPTRQMLLLHFKEQFAAAGY